jgi:hypothetical protein
MSYDDNLLIKLKRQYSINETVSALSKKLKESEIENGKLNAEIAHLEHEAKPNPDTTKEIIRLARVEVRKEELYLFKLNENKKLRKENIRLVKYRAELIHELLMLKNKK